MPYIGIHKLITSGGEQQSENEFPRKYGVYIYTMEHYSAIKKNEIMPFVATWMDIEITILSEVNQKEKDKYHNITYMWNLKYDTNEHIYETKRLTDIEDRHMVAKGEGRWGREGLGVWVSKCKLLYMGWINSKVLMYSTGNYNQYPVINHIGKEYENEYICL